MERQGKETRLSKRRKLLQNKQLVDENRETDEQSETLAMMVTHQSDTSRENCDGDSSEDNEKVGSRIDKKELTAFQVSW